MDHQPESVLRVFLHRSHEIIQKINLEEKLSAIAEAVVEAGLFRRVAVQLYAEVYGEKLFGWAGLNPEEEAWLQTHDTLGPDEYERIQKYGVDLGHLYFVPHEQLPNVFDDFDDYLLSSQDEWPGPGWWHPDDMLYAPLMASDGTPLGNVTADEPFNHRIPSEDTAALLTPFLAIAALLVEQALDRRRDTLTACFSGPFFRDEMARLAATDSLGGVLFLDMDNLKQINDRDGHAAGDRMIQNAAQQLQEHIRTIIGHRGRVFRLHGDEFVVLIRRGSPDMDHIVANLRTLRDMLGPVISLGGAGYTPGMALDDLTQLAEQDMYRDKGARKGLLK